MTDEAAAADVSAAETSTSAETSAELEEHFASAEDTFRRLCKEMHIPFLDVKVYEKYVLKAKVEGNLSRLQSVNEQLSEHKKRTMYALQVIQRREVIVICIFALTNDYVKGRIRTPELQAKVTRLLFMLQQSSLKVVESIISWRDQLTRPYPFMFQKLNYLLKIVADNHVISSSPLNQVLPLRLYDHPLCSHLPSEALFNAELEASRGYSSHPLQDQKMQVSQPSDSYRSRLKRAEAYIRQELPMQQVLVKELRSIIDRGLFLPVLNSPVVPGCMEGIGYRSSVWASKLLQALEATTQALVLPVTQMPMFPEYVSYADVCNDRNFNEDEDEIMDEEYPYEMVAVPS